MQQPPRSIHTYHTKCQGLKVIVRELGQRAKARADQFQEEVVTVFLYNPELGSAQTTNE